MEKREIEIHGLEELIAVLAMYFMRGLTAQNLDSDVLNELVDLLLIELKSREEIVH